MFLNVEMYPRRTVLNASQAPPGIRSKLDRTGLGGGGGGEPNPLIRVLMKFDTLPFSMPRAAAIRGRRYIFASSGTSLIW